MLVVDLSFTRQLELVHTQIKQYLLKDIMIRRSFVCFKWRPWRENGWRRKPGDFDVFVMGICKKVFKSPVDAIHLLIQDLGQFGYFGKGTWRVEMRTGDKGAPCLDGVLILSFKAFASCTRL
jgi:hypothetical protein